MADSSIGIERGVFCCAPTEGSATQGGRVPRLRLYIAQCTICTVYSCIMHTCADLGTRAAAGPVPDPAYTTRPPVDSTRLVKTVTEKAARQGKGLAMEFTVQKISVHLGATNSQWIVCSPSAAFSVFQQLAVANEWLSLDPWYHRVIAKRHWWISSPPPNPASR